MFLLEKGDHVRLSKQARDFLGKELFNVLSSKVFKIIDIKTKNTCEENNINCACDKFISVKYGDFVINSLVSEELLIVRIRQDLYSNV
jgi:hypothetical protein